MANTRIKIENFGGQVPRASSRLLPNTHAAIARNVKLHSGELRGIRDPKFLTEIDGAVKAYRIPDELGPDGQYTWIGLNSLDINVYRGPLLNDTFDRYYKFGDGAPQYNTLARLRVGLPWFLLGVPAPVNAGNVTPVGGSADPEERFYVYTFVSAYGEEGPPSTPISATGPSDASWDLSGLDTTVPDASQRNIVRKRVYRTVAGFSTAEFFLVHDDPISLPYDIPLASATYSDVATSDVVSRNTILESEQWFPPSADMTNAIAMPTGFFIGWSGRDVYFTESFRPHAWPPPYDLSTEYEIVGGGVFGQSAGLVTTGNPYIATGTSAAGTTLAKTSTVEPGLSPHGIVTMPYGVLYPSQNGLIQLTLNGAELITRGIITKNEWINDYSPTTLVAAQYQAAYIAFYSRDNGFMLDPTEQMATFSELDRFGNVDNVQTDPYTGDVFLIRAGKIYEWDAVDQPRVPYQWRSRDFILPRPNNFGAITIKSEGSDSFLVVDAEALSAAAAWNQARFDAGPLDFLGMNAIGDVFVFPMTTELTEYKAQNQQPIGGSPLIDVASWVRPVRLTVYADNQVVFSELWQGQRCIRLPSGFKSDTWAVQLEASETVFSVGIAETCKGLADV